MIDLKPTLAAHAQWLADFATGQRANLRGADLRGANLRGADLSCADLTGAGLSSANLTGADLSGADLRGANLVFANLRGANLTDANLSDADLRDANLTGADLSGADLRGASLVFANLRGADLAGVDLSDVSGLPFVADSAERLIAAAAAATAKPGALEMQSWHTCETTHCLGGWAIHQAGPLGALLERTLGASIAALLLLGPEAYAHFWDSNEDARAYLQSVLDEAKA
jgi:hypothetical protein